MIFVYNDNIILSVHAKQMVVKVIFYKFVLFC